MTRITTRSRSVEGKVVLITGAASGMGRATAFLFADEGAKVAVTDLGAERVAAVVDRIRAAGGTAHGVVLDVTDAEAIDAAVAEIRAELGPVDVVVNNAGVGAGSAVDNPGFEDEWFKAFEVMVTPHQRIIRACLDDLKASGEGRIVNIASTEGIGAQRNMAPYTSAKHGVIGLTRALAIDLGVHGITVNAICPGPIVTGMTEAIPDDMRDTFARRRTALRRYGDPEEVAHMTLSLALPAASFITGAIIPVDGGLTAKND
ncbi:MAG: SDR family NAD(P)-dependent oxidoreductase [Acidimicrobiales bacterium]|jgi:3-oxoacyl-[acyl-carrier protein] reductase